MKIFVTKNNALTSMLLHGKINFGVEMKRVTHAM